jgi:hypothetical protein
VKEQRDAVQKAVEQAQQEMSVRAYCDLLQMAFADGVLDAAEERSLEKAREQYGITMVQHAKYVHTWLLPSRRPLR